MQLDTSVHAGDANADHTDLQSVLCALSGDAHCPPEGFMDQEVVMASNEGEDPGTFAGH